MLYHHHPAAAAAAESTANQCHMVAPCCTWFALPQGFPAQPLTCPQVLPEEDCDCQLENQMLHNIMTVCQSVSSYLVLTDISTPWIRSAALREGGRESGQELRLLIIQAALTIPC